MSILSNVRSDKHYSKFVHWIKLISVTGGAQMVVQLTGMLSGIVLVNYMSKEEFAFYTLANSMFLVMTTISDGGISSGIMAQGSKVWQDKYALGRVISTGMQLRKMFSVFSLMLTLPILLYFLFIRNATWWQIITIVLALIPSFTATLSDSILEIVPKIRQEIYFLQKNQVIVNVLRLILNCIIVFIFPFTSIALLCNGLPRVYGNISLRKFVIPNAIITDCVDSQIRKDILYVVRRTLPGTLYFCISGQISVWLLSMFGSTNSLASLGAIGRFSMILGLFSQVVNVLVIPRFARLEENKRRIGVFFILLLVFLVFISFCTIAIFYLFSNHILFLLGTNYELLNRELVLTITAGCLSMISGVVFGLCASRGKPTHSIFIILGNLATVILGFILFNVGELTGVLYFNIFVNIFPVLLHTVHFYVDVYLKANE